MKFLPGIAIAEARGSIGGTTFSRNRFGQYTRGRAVPVNPNSDRQQAARNIFSQLAELWTSALTDVERAAWDLYASNVAFKDSLGQDIFLTGFNHYIRSNSITLAGGVARVDDGPTIFTLAETDETLEVTGSEATQLLSVAFDDTLDWAGEDEALMQIAMSRPQGAGTLFIKGPFRVADFILGSSITNPSSPQTMTAPFFITDGQVLQVQARILRADGRLSEPFLDTLAAGA